MTNPAAVAQLHPAAQVAVIVIGGLVAVAGMYFLYKLLTHTIE